MNRKKSFKSAYFHAKTGETSDGLHLDKGSRKGRIKTGRLLRLVQEEQCTERKRKWQNRELMTGWLDLFQADVDSF